MNPFLKVILATMAATGMTVLAAAIATLVVENTALEAAEAEGKKKAPTLTELVDQLPGHLVIIVPIKE